MAFVAGERMTVGEGRREDKGLGMTVRVNVWMSSGGSSSMHKYVPACSGWRDGMSIEPFPRSWRPESVGAGATGTGVDWKNQTMVRTGLPEATQSNWSLSPSDPCTSGGGHCTMARGTGHRERVREGSREGAWEEGKEGGRREGRREGGGMEGGGYKEE